jgi:CHASE2 domain-containing sensor protein
VLKNRAWTWGTVLILLREKFGDRFLRAKAPEIDKDLVKAEIDEDDLGDFGLKLEQDETWYAEPARLPEVGA